MAGPVSNSAKPRVARSHLTADVVVDRHGMPHASTDAGASRFVCEKTAVPDFAHAATVVADLSAQPLRYAQQLWANVCSTQCPKLVAATTGAIASANAAQRVAVVEWLQCDAVQTDENLAAHVLRRVGPNLLALRAAVAIDEAHQALRFDTVGPAALAMLMVSWREEVAKHISQQPMTPNLVLGAEEHNVTSGLAVAYLTVAHATPGFPAQVFCDVIDALVPPTAPELPRIVEAILNCALMGTTIDCARRWREHPWYTKGQRNENSGV